MWSTLNADIETESDATYQEVLDIDKKRLALLSISRDTSPIGTVARLDLLARSVIPKLLTQKVQWLVLIIYVATACAGATRPLTSHRENVADCATARDSLVAPQECH